jgi:hypothetical protein
LSAYVAHALGRFNAKLFNVQLKGGNAFVGDAEYFKEGNPEGFGFAVFVAGISPGFAEKQFPRFNFVPIKTHLVLKKLSLNVNGKYSLFLAGVALEV